jgi:hypothetical protein
MKKFSNNLKYIVFSFVLVLASFVFTHSASADTYYNACDGSFNTDYMISSVNVSNAGPFLVGSPVSLSATIQILHFCNTMAVQSINSAEIQHEFTPTVNPVFGTGTSLFSNQIIPAVSGPYPIVPVNYNFTTIPVVGTHYLHLSLKTVRSPIYCSPQGNPCSEITTIFNNYLSYLVYQLPVTPPDPVKPFVKSVTVYANNTTPSLNVTGTGNSVNVSWKPNFDVTSCDCKYIDSAGASQSCGSNTISKKEIEIQGGSYPVPANTVFNVSCTDDVVVGPPVVSGPTMTTTGINPVNPNIVNEPSWMTSRISGAPGTVVNYSLVVSGGTHSGVVEVSNELDNSIIFSSTTLINKTGSLIIPSSGVLNLRFELAATPSINSFPNSVSSHFTFTDFDGSNILSPDGDFTLYSVYYN